MKSFFTVVLGCILMPLCSLAQSDEVAGTVKDSLGNPLQFALVSIDSTYQAVQTDAQGHFSLRVREPDFCITVQLLGYAPYRNCYESQDAGLEIVLRQSPYLKDEVVISSTRVDDQSGVAHTNVDKKEIEAQNFGQDLPYILNNQTSVVTTSDAGNGFGYTGLRIRGSDATRINVTINGIPVNDAESQGAFWVDMPDIASSTDNIQIQRGVGTSTNGAGAFGGSLNLQTEAVHRNAYSELLLSGGSFNSWRATAKAGTGIINDHWSFDVRMSQLGSDGYIDRGRSDLRSWYMSAGYYGEKLSVKAITFSGRERTYQCWYGVSEDSIKAGNYTYNMAGLYYDTTGAEAFYKDQVDNYGQDYYQLHFTYQSNPKWILNWSLFATKGKGFYEEYRQGDLLSNYSINDPMNTPVDLVRRRWLDNWYYGGVVAARYNNFKGMQLTIGGASATFDGKHFGEVIWATGLPAGTQLGGHYYDDDALKMDNNAYVKVSQSIGKKLNVFVDVQARAINYSFTGLDSTGNQLPQDVSFFFLNPKIGLVFKVNEQQNVYAFAGMGNKEPNRDDFTNSSPESRPEHEQLLDIEAGWRFASKKIGVEVNLYHMQYTNQLVLTGKVNDVGAYTRENVASSYRRGIEITAGWNILPSLNFSGNVTLSQNKITEFHEFLDQYDSTWNYIGQSVTTYMNTDIAFSPSVISAGTLTWKNRKGLSAGVTGKYVGHQYLDNTASDVRDIEAYFTMNLNLAWTALSAARKPGGLLNELTFALQVNNLTNLQYSANGYTYGYGVAGTNSYYNYYYPQAGINVMGMVVMKFGK